MTKTYCDCCGNDIAKPIQVEGREFTFEHTNHLIFETYCAKKQLDLCYLCNQKIVSFVKSIQTSPDKDWYKI